MRLGRNGAPRQVGSRAIALFGVGLIVAAGIALVRPEPAAAGSLKPLHVATSPAGAFEGNPVTPEELNSTRGEGAGSSAITGGATTELAVILWDDYKRHRGNNPVNLNNGQNSSMNISINGGVR